MKTPMQESVVYFIVGGGLTKVGRSHNVSGRYCILQACSPVSLTLIHTCTGGQKLERAIHRVMRDRHHHNEWFQGEVTADEAEKLIYAAKLTFRENRKKASSLRRMRPFFYPTVYTELSSEHRRVVRKYYGPQDLDVHHKMWRIESRRVSDEPYEVLYPIPARE